MPDLYVSWSQYHQTIERLAALIYRSGWEFDQIVCIAKGGLRVGDILARVFDKPLAIFATSSYVGQEKRDRGLIELAQHLTMTTPSLGHRLLLVDDLVDSGNSLAVTLDWLKTHYSPQIEAIRTATLWYKACSRFVPDYYVEYLTDNPWIHQPFEMYERATPAEIATKHEEILDS